MEFTPEFHPAQAPLPDWVTDENRLSPAEAAAEAFIHHILVGLNRPAPSPLLAALVAVLNIPPGVSAGGAK